MSEHHKINPSNTTDVESRFREIISNEYTSGEWADLAARANEGMDERGRIHEYPLGEYEQYILNLGETKLPKVIEDDFYDRTGFRGTLSGTLQIGDPDAPISFAILDISSVTERDADGRKLITDAMPGAPFEKGILLLPMDYEVHEELIYWAVGPDENIVIGMDDRESRYFLEDAAEFDSRLTDIAGEQCKLALSKDGNTLTIMNMGSDSTTTVGAIQSDDEAN